MKIAFVSDFLPRFHPRAGGADWACLRVGELVGDGTISVEYYTKRADAKEAAAKPDVHFVPIIEDFKPPFARKYVEVLKWYVLQLDPIAFWYFLREFRRNRPEIVHLHRFRFLTMAPLLAARLLKIPVYFSVYDYWMFCTLETLVDEHNAPCRKFHSAGCWRCLPRKMVWVQKLLLMFRRKIFDAALAGIERFVVLSRSSRDILTAYGIVEDRITVIPLPYGKDIVGAREDTVPGNDTLAYVGWIQKRKGLDVLLRALPEVKRAVPGVKLFVVGPDVTWEKEYRALVDELVRTLHLEENVVMTGPQPNDSVQEYLRKAEVVVVPEQWENMSPVIVGEAMFNRRPVVGSRIGGIPDFVIDGKTGLLFEPGSPQDLAEKIVFLLKNKDKARLMGNMARETASTIFSNDAIREKYRSLYMKEKTRHVV